MLIYIDLVKHNNFAGALLSCTTRFRSREAYMQTSDQTAEAIRTAFRIADPMRLLAIGCPEDEYNAEVNDLVDRLARGEALDTFIVMDVFHSWFGEILPPRAADEVVNLVREFL